jgi:hypothetical protein
MNTPNFGWSLAALRERGRSSVGLSVTVGESASSGESGVCASSEGASPVPSEGVVGLGVASAGAVSSRRSMPKSDGGGSGVSPEGSDLVVFLTFFFFTFFFFAESTTAPGAPGTLIARAGVETAARARRRASRNRALGLKKFEITVLNLSRVALFEEFRDSP